MLKLGVATLFLDGTEWVQHEFSAKGVQTLPGICTTFLGHNRGSFKELSNRGTDVEILQLASMQRVL